ncbi:MAG: hypothetical protein IKH78_03590 [Ruminococcus sp.]|nr:hypothetical protein [Ruminococcus sp.]
MLKRIFALLLSAAMCLAAAPAAGAAAAEKAAVDGDVNGDGKLSISDVVLLQKWLTGYPYIYVHDWLAADLCKDGVLDVFDLAAMKRLLIRNSADNEDKLITPPVSVLSPSLPSTGINHILMFAVDFPDYHFEVYNPAEVLKNVCFGPENDCNSAYPLESVFAFFERSSYGRMHLTGDVFNYTAEYPIDHYEGDNGKALLEEVLEAYDGQTDYNEYDVNGDKVLDSVTIVVPTMVSEIDRDDDGIPDWWPFSVPYYGSGVYDGVKPGTYCVNISSFGDIAGFNNMLAHELCHAMGLPDYYRCTADDLYGTDGMVGNAGCELMDEGYGDLSAFSKLMLGWLAEDEIQIYTGEQSTFEISSMQHKPSCLIIPRDKDKGFLSEFFLIEYITGYGNDSAYFIDGRPNKLINYDGGVRILHCNAEIAEGQNGPEFRYSINSDYYDSSDTRQRVLRLASGYNLVSGYDNGNKFFNDSIEDFHWYDEEGGLTERTGIALGIFGPNPGPDYVEDSWSLSSSGAYWEDPSFLENSVYTIEIS